MPSDLEVWARTERDFLSEEVKGLRAGAKIISRKGEDITEIKLIELDLRLKHAQMVLDGIDNAQRP